MWCHEKRRTCISKAEGSAEEEGSNSAGPSCDRQRCASEEGAFGRLGRGRNSQGSKAHSFSSSLPLSRWGEKEGRGSCRSAWSVLYRPPAQTRKAILCAPLRLPSFLQTSSIAPFSKPTNHPYVISG